MEIKVLGSCCGNCDKVMAMVQEVVSEKGLTASIYKVTDVKEIVGYGVMRTPGLVVNGRVVASGRIPARDEILTWLSA